MQMEWGMEVHIYDTLWMNLHDGINLTLWTSSRISTGKRIILQDNLQQMQQFRHIHCV
jgi:hypothetical protein